MTSMDTITVSFQPWKHWVEQSIGDRLKKEYRVIAQKNGDIIITDECGGETLFYITITEEYLKLFQNGSIVLHIPIPSEFLKGTPTFKIKKGF